MQLVYMMILAGQSVQEHVKGSWPMCALQVPSNVYILYIVYILSAKQVTVYTLSSDITGAFESKYRYMYMYIMTNILYIGHKKHTT